MAELWEEEGGGGAGASTHLACHMSDPAVSDDFLMEASHQKGREGEKKEAASECKRPEGESVREEKSSDE